MERVLWRDLLYLGRKSRSGEGGDSLITYFPGMRPYIAKLLVIMEIVCYKCYIYMWYVFRKLDVVLKVEHDSAIETPVRFVNYTSHTIYTLMINF